ncbi:hypothetical protein F443_04386 [Phytophthora nicotianae P1569]|uniref:Uncharacterized protein n=1 Tax=Phytophthora nicotianae P1569 TaxID=1317065 RepID=V9FQ03_PHYNI|nr:hypothetical protein F443_04386 [Phytophthora nicotianae P1569]
MPRANTPRQQRAERRAAQVSTPRTPRAASKQSHAVLRGPRGSAVATSSNIRVTTGQTPRVGNDDEDIVMVNLREGQDEEQQPPPVRQVLHIQMQQPPPIPQDPAAQAVPRVRPGIVANAGGDDGGGSSGSSDDGRGDGGQPGGQAPPGPAGDGVGGGYQAQGGQRAAALPVPPPPPSPATAPLYATPATPAWVYQAPRQEKKLRLPKFKGLDEPKLTVKSWLKAVKNELRRQVTILRTEWREHEVFIEMVAS